jgi:TRAP-type C4-dicarboxylate transport system permease small subunit
MAETATQLPGLWRRITALYARLLDVVLALSVGILVIPVSLQIFSRYTALIPSYIWTEEMARFLLIWTIMIGAMIGVREGSHFEVDLLPRLGPRLNALIRIVSQLFVLMFALVFIWWGIAFTRFGWDQLSEIAELPMWTIFIAWPIAGATWVLFLGEAFAASLRALRKGATQ